MNCPQCGNSMPDSAAFCGQCGSRFTPADTGDSHGSPAADSGARRADLQKTRAMPDRPDRQRELDLMQSPPTAVPGRGIGGRRKRYTTDIVVVFDCTSSMTPFIEGMKDMAISFSRDLEADNIDARLGLVEYRDVKICEPTNVHGFAETAEDFRSWLASLTATGGGDEPESAIDAGYSAISEIRFREDAAKILVWITDASYHDPAENGRTMDDLIQELVSRKILAYVIGPDLPGYVRLADCMGGIFFDIMKNPEEFRRIVKSLGKSISETVPRMRDIRSAADAALGRTRAW